jgi:hypothetical protein
MPFGTGAYFKQINEEHDLYVSKIENIMEQLFPDELVDHIFELVFNFKSVKPALQCIQSMNL